ncbi:MAG: MBL fold metallo-hydrolase [Candidatus Jorgensenbacteria bacterium]|nr:MBL fold metallo-hydrolase [Candidatus Jorgensenbacteria bacterium]
MTISYQGDNYFKIQNGNDVILIDPTNARSLKGATAVVLTTLPPVLPVSLEGGLVVEHQGEYETKGIHIEGWSVGQDNRTEKTIYRIRWDDVVIGILGYLAKEPDPKILLALNGCDVVIIPAGGSPNILQSSAAKLVRQIEPSIVIPSLFKDPKPFIKEFGGDETKEEKLTIKKKDLVPHAMKVVLLSS